MIASPNSTTRMRVIRGASAQPSTLSRETRGPRCVEVVLEDDGGRDGVNLPLLAELAGAAALGTDDGFRFLGAEPFVPAGDGPSGSALDQMREVLSASGLRSARAVGIQGQTDHS